MTRKKNKGMWLRQTEREPGTHTGWILPMVSAMGACAVLILSGAELTGFRMLYSPSVMLLVSLCSCAAYGLLKRSQRQRWFYPGMLAVLLVLTLLLGKSLLNGVSLFWNRMGDTWTAQTGWVLPELEVQADNQSRSLLLLSVFVGLFCSFVCCGAAGCRVPVLPVLIPGLLLAGMIAFCEEPSFLYLLPVLLTAVLLLTVSVGGERSPKLSAAVYRVLPITVAAILMIAAVSVPAVQDWAAQTREDLQKKAHSHRYETEYTTLPEGDFSGYQNNENTKHPGLVVNMDTPEELYLRGFTGAVFENNCWTRLDRTVLSENKDLLYWLNLMEFNQNAQYEKAVFQSGVSENTVTVQNIGACSGYLYVPFNLCGETLQAENLNADGLPADGERIYVFTTVSGSTETILQTLEYLQTSEDTAVQTYKKAESAYRKFIYENYLQIPQETAAILQPHWDNVAARYGTAENLTRAQAQECVLLFLEECFPEEEKQTNIALPLGNVAGSSYQYATVAALTLRYFGIPARYAEGYIITEKMAAAEAGNSIEADSSCAGAWVEVYQDGIGWVPMDRLPGFEESAKNPDSSLDPTQNGAGKRDPEEGEELEEPLDSEKEEPEPDGGYMVLLPQAAVWSAVAVLALLLLLSIVLIIRRKLRLRSKQKLFNAQSSKDAVGWIFADTAALLAHMGIQRGNGSMQALTAPIKERFGDDYGEKYEAMVRLNAQALFSSREMNKEDKESALEFHAATLQQLRSNAKWNQRVWMQWILCLY